MTTIDKDVVRQERIAEFKTRAENQLRTLIQQAAKLHHEVTSAKTTTKRQYFQKKFNKVAADVKHVAAIVEGLSELDQPTDAQE